MLILLSSSVQFVINWKDYLLAHFLLEGQKVIVCVGEGLISVFLVWGHMRDLSASPVLKEGHSVHWCWAEGSLPGPSGGPSDWQSCSPPSSHSQLAAAALISQMTALNFEGVTWLIIGIQTRVSKSCTFCQCLNLTLLELCQVTRKKSKLDTQDVNTLLLLVN